MRWQPLPVLVLAALLVHGDGGIHDHTYGNCPCRTTSWKVFMKQATCPVDGDPQIPCVCGSCHQTLQHIIPTTDGGACLVLRTFHGDLGSYHACEHGCSHYLAKFDVGAAKASCPFHVNSGQHWKKKQSLDCCNPFFGQAASRRAASQSAPKPVDDAFLPRLPADMAKLVQVAVRCTRAALNVRLEFDHPFRGLVYSKGHFGDPECRHVHGDSSPGAAESRRTFEFAVRADRCGSTKVERKPREGDSFLENTIVVQSELGIQDWSDSARRLRCSWDSNTERTVSSSISVDQLDVIAARYAGSSAADSYMDVQHGRGPFSAPVTGLVKIGETLTLVVYALGSDVHVKDCLAHDGDLGHRVQLTDAHGCVAKPKLLGPWQKTTKTGATGASTIAFAYLKAFKFPDKVEVYLECNIEMCKRQCSELCSGTRRSKRQGLNESSGLAEPARVTRGIRVVAPDDAPEPEDRRSGRLATGDVCMSLPGFVTSLSAILALLLGSCLASVSLLVRVRQLAALPTSPAATKTLMDSDTVRKCRHV